MKIYQSIEELREERPQKPLVATIGLFDGLHLGHRHLIAATKEMARCLGAESLVITMDRHPLAVLRPEVPRPRTLASLRQKEQLIETLGADRLLILPFTQELAALSASEFVRPLQEVGLVGLMLGYDNRFGRKVPGQSRDAFDQQLLEKGLRVERVQPFEVGGAIVSSSHIRDLIARNRLKEAEELLGRPFSIVGRVQEGRKIGHTIGFPTANIRPYDPSLTLPEEGVYISEVRLQKQVFAAMSYYGSTPTITPDGEVLNRVEAHLFGFKGNLYGEELEVAFRQMLRGDQRFESLEKLQEQLRRDAEASRQFFYTHPFALKGSIASSVACGAGSVTI